MCLAVGSFMRGLSLLTVQPLPCSCDIMKAQCCPLLLVSLFVLHHGIMDVADPGGCWPFWGALRRGLCWVSPSDSFFCGSSNQSVSMCHSWALWRRWGFVLKALCDSSGSVLAEKHFYNYLGYPVCDRQFPHLQREITSALRASQKG